MDEDDRLARRLAAKARLGAEAAERQAAYEAKLAKRKEFKEATGREMVGHKPKPRGAAERCTTLQEGQHHRPRLSTMSTANEGY